MHDESWIRFRCRCGRTVATPTGSEAAVTRRCSRCRARGAERRRPRRAAR